MTSESDKIGYTDQQPEDLQVLFNGTCPICSREIAVYGRTSAKLGRAIRFLDITTPEGKDAIAAFGLSSEDAAKRFHVIAGDELVSGVAAFALLWDQLPGFRWLACLSRMPITGWIANTLYDRVAAPLLYGMHKRRVRKAEKAAEQH